LRSDIPLKLGKNILDIVPYCPSPNFNLEERLAKEQKCLFSRACLRKGK
jgi:hypothetical protein